jgi:glutamine amidotransferase-like uncharacterized protein
MEKTQTLVCILVALFATQLVFSASCPINSSNNIVIYGQTGTGGVGTLSKSWMTHFFDWWTAQDPSLSYRFLTSANVKTDCNLSNYPNLKLYVQPGGDAYNQQRTLSSAGKNNILGFINSGKAYLGTCAGWYYASNDYYWQGSYYNWPNLLMRFPTVEGSITDIADYDVSPGYAMTTLSNGQHMIYYGGPTRGWHDTPNTYPGTALMTFAAIPNNSIAAVKNGTMLFTSVHAEAYENDGITGLSTAQRVENYKWLANAINDVAGTSFSVPAYSQCHDGTDNDGDGYVDLNDPGCNVIEDNNESAHPQCSDGIDNDADGYTDYPNDTDCTSLKDSNESTGPTELFADGFEYGIGGWTLTKDSGANYWTAATTDPYEGSYGAQVYPMDTTNPASSMEKAISTTGYSNITVSYYRKLSLPTALKVFKAKWYDGTTWYTLESANNTNDASYQYRSFTLPSGAENNPNFKIKFECTAGSVSNFCRADSVLVTSG